MQERVRQVYPTMTFTISLERMIASVEKANAPVQTITAVPQPPPIFVSNSPAILLLVEGKARARSRPRHHSAIRRQHQLGSVLR